MSSIGGYRNSAGKLSGDGKGGECVRGEFLRRFDELDRGRGGKFGEGAFGGESSNLLGVIIVLERPGPVAEKPRIESESKPLNASPSKLLVFPPLNNERLVMAVVSGVFLIKVEEFVLVPGRVAPNASPKESAKEMEGCPLLADSTGMLGSG
jgi:hypothetical protein